MTDTILDAPPKITTHRFAFEGYGADYFVICVRTLLLAIITFGIYDAWGTVERRRYFWGKTTVAGHGFDYHAKPMQILVGRLIVVGILIAVQFTVSLVPSASVFVLGAFVFLLPWVYNRVLAFQIGNTSYRNVRFRFEGSYWQAFLFVVVLPVFILPLTLGLLYPLIAKLLREYTINRTYFGRVKFFAAVPLRPLYKVFALGVFLIIVPCTVAFGFVSYEYLTIFSQTGKEGGIPEIVMQKRIGSLMPYIIGLYALIIIVFVMVGAVFNIVLRNVAICVTQLQGGHRFASEVPVFGYLWCVVSRSLLATVTLGLLLPWAKVDIRRYVMGYTTLFAHGDLKDFIGVSVDPGGAAAAEYGIMDGIGDGAFGV